MFSPQSEYQKIPSIDTYINEINEEEMLQEKKRQENRKFIYTPFEAINYSKFDEMRIHLDEYFTLLFKSVKDNLKFEGESFKKTFFNSLENLLIQICLIKDQNLKVTKIDDVYKWYNKKWKFHLNISKIDKKTTKMHYEKYPLPDTYKKTHVVTEKDKEDNQDMNNRTKIDCNETLRYK